MPPKDGIETETSMREDMEAAINAVEQDTDGAITTETQSAADEQENLNDAEGQEAKKTATDEAQGESPDGKTAKAGEDPDSDPDAARRAAKPESSAEDDAVKAQRKPPASWSPETREEWAKLPAGVRAQITKRESEIDKALNEGAQHRKAGEKFQGLADQYAQIIAAEGATDALHGTEELFKTVATLRMGSAQQKAQKIAGFIQHYGIDIGLLDDILSNNLKGKNGGAAPEGIDDKLAAYLDSRLGPVDKLLSQMTEQQRATQFQKNQDAINEVMQFKQDTKHEFYADVQNDMADMVEMAEKRGYIMPLQEAYDKACALNPEISKVLSKRAADDALKGGQQELDKKKHAASSISGQQGGMASPDELDMRGEIARNWDAQVG